jgi:hypothetical protein
MFFILNNEGLNYLLSQNFFDEDKINNYDNIQDIVLHYEVRLSQLILRNNWNIGSILSKFKNIDFKTQSDYIYNTEPYTKEQLVFSKDLSWYIT